MITSKKTIMLCYVYIYYQLNCIRIKINELFNINTNFHYIQFDDNY